MTDVRIHTVGHILDGKYKDWYVFIQTNRRSSSYLILKANNITFGRDDDGNLIEGSLGYDSWMPDMLSVEYHFELNFPNIEWLDDQKLKWIPNHAD
ncbi:MAG: hypothetical protein ABI970_25260 [Chloroflexota bacterium]